MFDQAKSSGTKRDGFDQLEKSLAKLEKGTEVNSIAKKSQEHGTAQLQPLIDLYTQSQYQEALTQASQLLEQFPNSINLYNIMGASNKGLGELGEAIEAYKKAISIKPDYADAYNNLGNALKDQGKLEEAVEAFNKALSMKLDYSEAYYNMGITLKDQGKLDKAIEAYRKALSIKPDFAEAYIDMGNALKEQGKLDKAIQAYTKALSLKPDYDEAHYGLAAIFYETGDTAAVMENLRQINSGNHPLRLPYKLLTILKYNEKENAIGFKKSTGLQNSNKFPLISERNVEDKLVKCLYKLSARSLDETKDARYGSGKCSQDFELFETDDPIIKKVAADLLQSMEKLLGGTILYHDSFFNILGAGGGTKPHAHLKKQDSNFDLNKYKFSLVYYLSVGDQNCTEPGTLKLYEPNFDILPTKGMCVLIPASRKHSAIYNGSKDRIMIGCNFYLV